MAQITLIMTRKPIDERFFTIGGIQKSALFGTMALVLGPKIYSANPYGATGTTPRDVETTLKRDMAFLTTVTQAVACAPTHKMQSILLAGRSVGLLTDGTPLAVLQVFDTMERYRGDNGLFGRDGFIMTDPRPTRPYWLTMESGNSIVAKVNTDGRCLRIHDHGKRQLNGSPAGLLIHEAPHVNWLTGCISPRLQTNMRQQGHDKQPSHDAMEFIFNSVKKYGGGREASLIVLD